MRLGAARRAERAEHHVVGLAARPAGLQHARRQSRDAGQPFALGPRAIGIDVRADLDARQRRGVAAESAAGVVSAGACRRRGPCSRRASPPARARRTWHGCAWRSRSSPSRAPSRSRACAWSPCLRSAGTSKTEPRRSSPSRRSAAGRTGDAGSPGARRPRELWRPPRRSSENPAAAGGGGARAGRGGGCAGDPAGAPEPRRLRLPRPPRRRPRSLRRSRLPRARRGVGAASACAPIWSGLSGSTKRETQARTSGSLLRRGSVMVPASSGDSPGTSCVSAGVTVGGASGRGVAPSGIRAPRPARRATVSRVATPRARRRGERLTGEAC